MLTVGADPEFFLMSEDGDYVSAHKIVPGTKRHPFKVNRGAVQVDGMALEFNIDPTNSSEEFIHNITTVLTILRKMVPKELKFRFDPVATFGKEYIAAQPVKARVLGCDLDFDAWGKKENNPPNPKLGFRTAAGHLHLGWREEKDMPSEGQAFDEACLVAKQLDYFLGIPSLLIDPDNTRRMMYGKAGTFRTKPYGMEYRTLSNFWLKSTDLMEWVFQSASVGFNLLMQGNNYEKIYRDKARFFINSFSDKTNCIRNFLEDDVHLSRILKNLDIATG
jgi:hypothetical protein